MTTSYVRHDDLRIYQGDDRSFTWPVTDDNDDPLDLRGWDARAQVRPVLGGEPLLHEWSLAEGNVTLDGSTVTLHVADSEQWDWSAGCYDIHLTDPDGKTQVLARGTVVVDRGATHA